MRSGVAVTVGIALLMLVPVCLPGPASASDSYAAVKRALFEQVFAEDRRTLYCGCPFDAERKPDLAACGYVSPSGGVRAGRVEVDHVVPASWIGAGRPCWQEKLCRDAQGRAFKGRKCCLAIDPAFRAAYQDLHNLRPTIGEVNERRSNYRFGLIDGEARDFGACDIEIDGTSRRAEPRPEIRGDVARISLYMEAVHGVRLSAGQRRLFQAWHRADPPDAAEIRRHDAIERVQGRTNPWIARPASM
ncbi:MAG: endonuclease [Alphaproteobacteria bacterium]